MAWVSIKIQSQLIKTCDMIWDDNSLVIHKTSYMYRRLQKQNPSKVCTIWYTNIIYFLIYTDTNTWIIEEIERKTWEIVWEQCREFVRKVVLGVQWYENDVIPHAKWCHTTCKMMSYHMQHDVIPHATWCHTTCNIV